MLGPQSGIMPSTNPVVVVELISGFPSAPQENFTIGIGDPDIASREKDVPVFVLEAGSHVGWLGWNEGSEKRLPPIDGTSTRFVPWRNAIHFPSADQVESVSFVPRLFTRCTGDSHETVPSDWGVPSILNMSSSVFTCLLKAMLVLPLLSCGDQAG